MEKRWGGREEQGRNRGCVCCCGRESNREKEKEGGREGRKEGERESEREGGGEGEREAEAEKEGSEEKERWTDREKERERERKRKREREREREGRERLYFECKLGKQAWKEIYSTLVIVKHIKIQILGQIWFILMNAELSKVYAVNHFKMGTGRM